MKVLVTGAAGFLGSHLMMYHLTQGDQVLGIDNYSSSRLDSRHATLIKDECRKRKAGYLICGDISIERDLWACFSDFELAGHGNQIDLIYNFACPASPPRYQAIPIQTMRTCTAGVENVLEMARRFHSIVVHASTSEVYGDPTVSPQSETYRGCVNSYGPRSCYDEGKRAAEALCYDYLNQHKVDARLVRIFNTYGPNMDPDDGRVVSNFVCQALRGERLTVYGEGEQSRSFCYVDDLIRGIIAVGALGRNPRAPINLGNPNEFTMLTLALTVQRHIDGPSAVPNLHFLPMPIDDPAQRCPDISRARELLGWEPQVELDEGLSKTVAYFRAALNM